MMGGASDRKMEVCQRKQFCMRNGLLKHPAFIVDFWILLVGDWHRYTF